MRTAAILSLFLAAGALTGCHSGAGHSVEFVAANTDSVLLDLAARSDTELAAATQTATQDCQLFNRRTAQLESLNARGDGDRVRATYLCRNGMQSAEATSTSMAKRRQ